MKSKSILTVFVISMLTAVLLSGIGQVNIVALGPSTGPYIDEAVYKVISSIDQQVLALQAGVIEFSTNFVDPAYYALLDSDPNIDVHTQLRNGYGQITINCRDAPLNWTALRRAFAFAYDKTQVRSDIWLGFSELQDSVVPYVNSLFCVEDDLAYHYYTPEYSIGNAILDAAGFDIDPGTGFREDPNGNPIHIVIGYSPSSPAIAGGCAQQGVDALGSLHISAETDNEDFNTYLGNLYNHGDYDMLFYYTEFSSTDVDWLAYQYGSDYTDVYAQNPSNFDNATYDSWISQLLYGSTYAEVYEAAEEMQKILHYNVPILVVYEDEILQGYRTDVYTGHVADGARGISGQWTLRNIHRIDSTPGGTVDIALGQEPDSFNFFVSGSRYTRYITENLWPSLYKYGPDLSPRGDLAEDILVETNAENSSVPVGHKRFSFNIIQNATWSDGVPLTAEDVAHSFTYMYESAMYGNPKGIDLGDLVTAYAPSPYVAVVEFSTDSYWHFSRIAYDYIFPKHIFNDTSGIGYAGWNTWNPVFNPSDPHVTCGPFNLTDYEAGEYYELSKNPLFHYAPETTTTTTTSTTTTTTPPGDTTPPDISSVVIDPLIPYDTDDVLVTVTVIDATGVDEVILTYSVDGVIWTNQTMTHPQTDTWTTTIPHQAPDVTVMYTVYANDTLGNGVTTSVFSYTVQDSSPPTTTTTPPSTTTTTTTTTSTTTSDPGGIEDGFLNTLTLAISLGSVVVILIVAVVFVKSRS